MSAWTCESCRRHIENSFDRVERRVEYRRKSNDGRVKTVEIGHLCVDCAKAEAEEIRSGNSTVVITSPHSIQEALL